MRRRSRRVARRASRSRRTPHGGPVDVPADLARVLAAAKLRAAFDAFSFSHRREFAEWVTPAKRAETRAARVPKVVTQVRAKAGAVSSK